MSKVNTHAVIGSLETQKEVLQSQVKATQLEIAKIDTAIKAIRSLSNGVTEDKTLTEQVVDIASRGGQVDIDALAKEMGCTNKMLYGPLHTLVKSKMLIRAERGVYRVNRQRVRG